MPLPIIQYGIDWKQQEVLTTANFCYDGPETSDGYRQCKANREMFCFYIWHSTENGGLGRYRHARNAIKALWPETEFNEWMEWRLREFCNESNWSVNGNQRVLNIASVGCAGSGKTHDWTFFSLFWWLCAPDISTVVLCSIQKNMIRQRCWAVIQEKYNNLPCRFGNMVDSQTKLQVSKGDDKHSVFAQAVESGEANKAKQRIAGLHLPRVMIVIDEAPGTPEGIFEAVSNLTSGCSELVVASSGNAISRLNAHGRVCEPVDGWNSVDQDTEMWKTKGVREWKLPPGVCLHFHGKRSPNVKRSKTVFPYLYTYENWQAAKGNEDTPNFWTYDAGFWAPEGISNTVFDEPTIQRVDGMGAFTWQSYSYPVAALDPSFGGDECVLRIGTIGDIGPGRMGLQIGAKIPIRLKQKSPRPVDYQIADQVIEACKKYNVKPENFGLDASGTGRGVAAILQETWSPMIKKVEFGGAPSDTPVSAEDPRACSEVYDRRVTELWYNCREVLGAGQLRGLDLPTCSQFCSRFYENKVRKIRLETKAECKERTGRSPDDADCVAVMVEVARGLGLSPKRNPVQSRETIFMKKAKEADEVYHGTQLDEEDPDQQPSPFAWMEE